MRRTYTDNWLNLNANLLKANNAGPFGGVIAFQVAGASDGTGNTTAAAATTTTTTSTNGAGKAKTAGAKAVRQFDA